MKAATFSRNLKRFDSVSFTEKKLFIEALFYLLAAKVLLAVVPFRYCLWLLKSRRSWNKTLATEQLNQIKKAIHRTRWLVFWKNECLVKSVASRWMLQRRQIYSSFSLGAAFDKDKNLIAHAWLNINEFEMVEKGGSYYELHKF